MDRHLGGEAVAARGFGFGAETVEVAEICEDPVDRRYVRGDGADQRQRAGERTRAGISAVGQAVASAPRLAERFSASQATPSSRALAPR